MALDSNFVTVVDNLEDIRWVREWNGGIDIGQPGPPIILWRHSAHAVVLIPQQPWKKEVYFCITKWQRYEGAWRLKEDMRLNKKTLLSIATPEVLEKLNAFS